MKKLLLYSSIVLIFLTFGFNFCAAKEKADKVYLLNLYYNRGEIFLTNALIKDGYAPDRKIQPENGYECRVVSSSGENLYSFKFFVPLTISAAGAAGTALLNNTGFSLTIPCFKSAKSINIYDPSSRELKLTVDVSQLPAKGSAKNGGLYFGILLIIFAGAIIYYLFSQRKKQPAKTS